MLKHRELTVERIHQFGERLQQHIYADPVPMRLSYLPSAEPMDFATASKSRFRPIQVGTEWGRDFDCAWFRVEGDVAAGHRGKEVVALIDLGGEACLVDRRGKPVQGLTARYDDRHGGLLGPKREIRLFTNARGNEKVRLLLDAGANRLMGRQRRCVVAEATLCVRDENAFKLYHEFRFLELLMLDLEEASRHGQLILRCLNDVCNLVSDFTDTELRAARVRVREELQRPARNSAIELSAIGHAHIDVAWLWPLRETVRKCARTFSTALRMMEEYPQYRFGASQPHLYQMVKAHYPELYREIKDAVARGLWEVQGAMWVESDCNIPSGESLVRQVLHGKRFFLREFGVEVRHLWLPDVFGYSGALPQILKKSRVDYFVTHKLNWNQFNKFPHHTMYWQGIDGTRVFAHFMNANDYNIPATPHALRRYESECKDGDRTNHALCMYGIGDGGGGPGRTHIEWASLANDLEDMPRVRMEHAAEFFPKAQAASKDLMTWVGELYFEYHRGTYTTQALVKRMNRKLELLIREVEFVYSQLPLGGYPARELDRLWKVILLNQFHDIIPGSSITRVYREAHEQYREAEAALESLLGQGLARLTSGLRMSGLSSPRVFSNSLSWDREADVLLPGERALRWQDRDGNPLLAQKVSGGVLVRASVPSMGMAAISRSSNRGGVSPLPMRASERLLENDRVRVRFARDGSISSIRDRKVDREVLAGKGNRFCLYEDLPLAFEAWDIDLFYLEKSPTHPGLVATRVVETGPLRAAIEHIYEAPGYTIRQIVSLTRGSAMVTFDTEVDWKESQKMLRVEFPVGVHAHEANYEIQFGHLARPTHANTSWDMARFEVVAHRWADISQPNYGVALVNDCKYGHRIAGNTISLNLLRSPTSPDPEADRHHHRFRYALYPHEGDHIAAEVVRRAFEFNVAVRVTEPGRGGRARRPAPFVRLGGGSAIVDSVKKSEDGRDLVFRLYESSGIDCRTELTFGFEPRSVHEVDLLEENGSEVTVRKRSVRLSLSPFEIKTLRVAR